MQYLKKVDRSHAYKASIARTPAANIGAAVIRGAWPEDVAEATTDEAALRTELAPEAAVDEAPEAPEAAVDEAPSAPD